MKIEHVAIWAEDIERLRDFYQMYFGAVSNDRYDNPAKGFSSYFLSFDTGARLEIMQMVSVGARIGDPQVSCVGWAHLAFSVGSHEQVDQLTQILAKDGYSVVDGPRLTGDGYYESVVLDPEQNRIEITA